MFIYERKFYELAFYETFLYESVRSPIRCMNLSLSKRIYNLNFRMMIKKRIKEREIVFLLYYSEKNS